MKNKSDQMKPSQYNNTSNLLLQNICVTWHVLAEFCHL